MNTGEEQAKLAKLLHEIEVPEVKLTERCSDLVRDFQEKFGKEIESEEQSEATKDDANENPYKVDKRLLDDIDKRLQDLVVESRRAKKDMANSVALTGSDPKRPWRTNSTKERLLRIENDIRRHHEKANELIAPLADGELRELVRECREENRKVLPVTADRLRNTVEEAKKNLPNFQYRQIENSTATAVLPEAHQIQNNVKNKSTDSTLN